MYFCGLNLFCASKYLIPEKTDGVCRAAGGEQPTKERGWVGNERTSEWGL